MYIFKSWLNILTNSWLIMISKWLPDVRFKYILGRKDFWTIDFRQIFPNLLFGYCFKLLSVYRLLLLYFRKKSLLDTWFQSNLSQPIVLWLINWAIHWNSFKYFSVYRFFCFISGRKVCRIPDFRLIFPNLPTNSLVPLLNLNQISLVSDPGPIRSMLLLFSM